MEESHNLYILMAVNESINPFSASPPHRTYARSARL